MACRGHPFPHSIHVCCPVQLVLLLVGIRAVTLRDDKPSQNGLGALLGRKRGKREADVVPVDRLMEKVAQKVTV